MHDRHVPVWICVVLLHTWPSNILGKRKKESASLLQGLDHERIKRSRVEKLTPVHPNETMAAVVIDHQNPKVSALDDVGEGNSSHHHLSPEFSSFQRSSQHTLQALPKNSVLIMSNLVLVALLASYCLYTRWQSPQSHDDKQQHTSGAVPGPKVPSAEEDEADLVFVSCSSSRRPESGRHLSDKMARILMPTGESQSKPAEASSSAEQYTEESGFDQAVSWHVGPCDEDFDRRPSR